MGINGRKHDELFPILLKIYPEQKCMNCGKTPKEKKQSKHNIFHLDRNDKNNEIPNLIWLCHGCCGLSEFRKANLLGYDFVSMNPSSRLRWIEYLIEKNGQMCGICKEKLTDYAKIIIDHIDNTEHTDKDGIKGGNLQLLCRSCNTSKNPPYSDLKGMDQQFTAAMKIHRSRFRLFAQWLWDQIRVNGNISYDEAIDSGSYVCKCSTETIKRYLRTLCASKADFEISVNQFGNDTIYRRGLAPKMQYDIMTSSWVEK